MRKYPKKPSTASRAALSRRLHRNPDSFPLEAFRKGQRVHAGELDHAEEWDALFIAAVAAGIDQLTAQETIGRQFRIARIFPLEAMAPEVAA